MTTDAVKAALSELDGSPESAISLLAGVPVEQIGEYGGMPDDAPCTCRAYHPDYNHHTDADRPVCGEPADPSRFFRCQKPAGHTGDRHHTAIPGGDYTWGYVPTPAEVKP